MYCKKIPAILLLLLSVSLYSQTVRVATIEGSPVSTICSMILTEIYREAGYELEVIAMPAVRATKESTEGSIDGETHRISTYGGKHPELIMVPFSYYSVDTVLFSLADHPARHLPPDQLNRYRFAILKGVERSRELTEGFEIVTEFEDSETMLHFLKLERADFALLSRLHGISLIEKNGLDGIVAYEPPLEKTELYHYLHKSQSHLIPELVETMENLSRSGKLDRIITMIENIVLRADEPAGF